MQRLTSVSELSLQNTLNCGQSFRWKSTGINQFTSVIRGIVVTLNQQDDEVFFRIENGDSSEMEIHKEMLSNYFQLQIKLEKINKTWINDRIFQQALHQFQGVRILRIDPIENLFSFICSSNNNIPRITMMVDNMSKHYGKFVGNYYGIDFYSFPTVKSLVDSEDKLRELGFGYRAKYISQTAKYLNNPDTYSSFNGPDEFLNSLMNPISVGDDQCLLTITKEMLDASNNTRSALMKCPGVGPKVADCVSLMSMGFHHIIPMDTHMIQVAEKYGISSKPPSKKRKLLKENRNQNSSATINKKVNNVNDGIQSQFQHLFGVYAGWAQSVLFAADLKWLETSKNS